MLPSSFVSVSLSTKQKVKFFIKDFLSKCDKICKKLRIWSYLLKKSLIENFIFFGVFAIETSETFLTVMGHISWAIRSIRQFGELFYVEFGFWIWSLREKVYPVIIMLFFKWVIPGFPQVFWLTLMWVGGNSPTFFWFPLNNSENIKDLTLVFCSIQSHFVRDFRAKFGISNFPQCPDIEQNSEGVFPISGFLVNVL